MGPEVRPGHVRQSRSYHQLTGPDSFVSMNPRPADPLMEITGRLNATRLEFDMQVRRFEDARARLQATFEQIRQGRPQRQKLHDSAFARLQARMDTMPVIEQAKGILMAQHRCPPEEAFELLRRASQNANVRVSVLAARIVEQVASPEPRPAGRRPLPTSGGRGGKVIVHRAR
jgi:ANTAR domain